MIEEHLKRLNDARKRVYHLHNLSTWVEKYIRLDGKRMSVHGDYSFQADILDDTSRVNNTVKPAQIGLTTTTIAYFLAGMATQRPFNVIYSLPSASDAGKMTTTKINPIIRESAELRRLQNKEVDSTELKEIAQNFLYIRGSRSETAALSVSADCLVADEIDRSDPDTLKQFRSRLQASKLKIIRQFSTPTIDGLGISKEAETSRRMRHFATCQNCSHTWLPSYHTDIRVPGYEDDLKHLTRTNIKDVRWREAHWTCPACGKDPKLTPTTLQWVCENPQDQYEAVTYYVTPVTACKLLLPDYLVRTSTEFNTRAEWQNQVLGETSEDTNEQLTIKDIEDSEVDYDLSDSSPTYMGFDMGLLCACTIVRLHQDNFIVVHREMVPLAMFETRRAELIRTYKVICSVHDVMPYVTEIMRVTEQDPNAYGAIFTTSKSPELYTIQEKEEDLQEARLNLRRLKVNRTALLDTVKDMFKAKQIVMKSEPNLRDQYVSLKRTQVFQQDTLTYVYQKTDGEDHMHFSLGYALLASKLRQRVGGKMDPTKINLVSKFTVKQNVV